MQCRGCHAEYPEGARSCASCGLLLPGTVVTSRYEILEFLGKGGMGVVYKAKDRVLDDIVALKLLGAQTVPPELAERFADMARRLRSEIRLARRVTHRNVCRIHEYGEEGSLRYIAMELVDGADLKQELRERGHLPPREAFEVSIAVGEALEAIHEQGIVHRDLKTPNIMRDRRGAVKVMDFGIAKPMEVDAAGGLTGTGVIVGTPDYLSPEQARALPIDARSDLYSLGVVIFELFTGRLPFKGRTPMDAILMHIQQPPPLEGPLASWLPAAVVPVLRRALAKDPDDRYGSAREMVDALRAALEQCLQRPDPRPIEVVPGAVAPAVEPAPAPTPVPTSVPTSQATAVPTVVPMPATVPASGAATAVEAARVRHADVPLDTRPDRGKGPAVRSPRRLLSRNAWTALGAILAGSALAWFALPRSCFTVAVPPGDTAVPSPTAAFTTAPSARLASHEPPKDSSPTPAEAAERLRPTRTERHLPSASAVAEEAPRRVGPNLAAPEIGRPSPPAPSPAPSSVARSPTPSVSPPQPGVLQLVVHPWAEVTVNGRNVGTTPLRPLVLVPGEYVLLFTNPGFRSERRVVTIVAGETVRLEVELRR